MGCPHASISTKFVREKGYPGGDKATGLFKVFLSPQIEEDIAQGRRLYLSSQALEIKGCALNANSFGPVFLIFPRQVPAFHGG